MGQEFGTVFLGRFWFRPFMRLQSCWLGRQSSEALNEPGVATSQVVYSHSWQLGALSSSSCRALYRATGVFSWHGSWLFFRVNNLRGQCRSSSNFYGFYVCQDQYAGDYTGPEVYQGPF